jgi:hypothetical protein
LTLTLTLEVFDNYNSLILDAYNIRYDFRFTKDEKYLNFKELEIRMTTYPNQHNTTLDCSNVVYCPSSMRYNKFPLLTKDFIYRKSSQIDNDINENGVENYDGVIKVPREEILYKIVEPQNELVSFAVWGRMYLRDVNGETDTSDEDIKNYLEIENRIYKHTDEEYLQL